MRDDGPTWSGLADHWENVHPVAFAIVLGFKEDVGAELVAMVQRALRFAEAHDVTYPRDLPKSDRK